MTAELRRRILAALERPQPDPAVLVALLREATEQPDQPPMSMVTANHDGARTGLDCSFCGKGRGQVDRLVGGRGGIGICNECVDLCKEIMGEKDR